MNELLDRGRLGAEHLDILESPRTVEHRINRGYQVPKRRSLSDKAQEQKSNRLKSDPIGMSIAEVVARISTAPANESQTPSTKEHLVPTHMTDQEFEEWSDRVAQELCDNLNRNVRLEEQEDRERKTQK